MGNIRFIQHFQKGNWQGTVFKGGTALSKCFGLIHRFSEGIGLVVLRKESETENQLKNKIKKISKSVSNLLPEIEIDGIMKFTF